MRNLYTEETGGESPKASSKPKHRLLDTYMTQIHNKVILQHCQVVNKYSINSLNANLKKIGFYYSKSILKVPLTTKEGA